jgi:hypothetical protein
MQDVQWTNKWPFNKNENSINIKKLFTVTERYAKWKL